MTTGNDAFVAAMLRAHPELPYTGHKLEKEIPVIVEKVEITCKHPSFDTLNASERDPVEVIHRDIIDVSSDIYERLIQAKRRDPHMNLADTIVKIVCYASGFNAMELKSPRRHMTLTRWRQICMFVIYNNTTFGTPAIGQKLGGRDHTTVLHALKKINANYDAFKADIELVESFL